MQRLKTSRRRQPREGSERGSALNFVGALLQKLALAGAIFGPGSLVKSLKWNPTIVASPPTLPCWCPWR